MGSVVGATMGRPTTQFANAVRAPAVRNWFWSGMRDMAGGAGKVSAAEAPLLTPARRNSYLTPALAEAGDEEQERALALVEAIRNQQR